MSSRKRAATSTAPTGTPSVRLSHRARARAPPRPGDGRFLRSCPLSDLPPPLLTCLVTRFSCTRMAFFYVILGLVLVGAFSLLVLGAAVFFIRVPAGRSSCSCC